MPGNRRRSSTAAENSPPWLNAVRIAAASASVTTNIVRAWEGRSGSASCFKSGERPTTRWSPVVHHGDTGDFPQSDRGNACSAPCGQQKTKRGTVDSKNPQQHHGRDGYCSSAGPDCGDDQKISDRVGQRTSHCLFGSVPRRRGQSAASNLKSSGIGISGPYCCIKRSVCNFPWRGHIRQAISISAVRAATAPSRIEPLDALTSAPRTRGQARD
jgi:hypothetical protein